MDSGDGKEKGGITAARKGEEMKSLEKATADYEKAKEKMEASKARYEADLKRFKAAEIAKTEAENLEIVRIIPQLLLLFLVYFGAAKHLGMNMPGELAAVIVFTFWGTAEMGDLVRSALISIPKHQYESGYGLGLTKLQVFIYIIFPQTIRRLLPSAINLLTRMIKTTSLVVLIGVVEVVKVGKQIIDASRYTASDSALWVYGAIFLMYFVICFPFSRLSAFLGKKLAG